MRKIIIMAMVLILIATATALEECEPVVEPNDIPCQITSSWDYLGACNTYEVKIYESDGTLINSRYMDDFAIYCNITFNYTDTGTYYFNISSGDSGSLIVERENMVLSIVIGAGIVAFILLFLAISLAKEHFILKFLLIVSSIITLLLIPASFLGSTTETIFFKFYIGFVGVFFLYIFVYFSYIALMNLGLIAGAKK